MKHLKKIMAVCLASFMLFSVTGCEAIREMKEQQAFWAQEGKTDRIEWNGHTFRRYEGMDDRYAISMSVTSSRGYVTEKEIPALLQDLYGRLYVMSPDQCIMQVDYDMLYIREDVYDEAVKALSGKSETVYYTKRIHYGMDDGSVTAEIRELSADTVEKIFAIRNDEKRRCTYFEREEYLGEDYKEADLTDGIYRSNAYLHGTAFDEEYIGDVDLYLKDGRYLLFLFFFEDDLSGDGYWYLVPESETETLRTELFP